MTGWAPCGIVTLLSDFGSRSSYPGSLRGAILTVSRDLRLADITHDVPAFDVASGALTLRAAAPSFPSGTVHLAVVDPGVGSERRPIAVHFRDHVFVGPDNGLFTPFLDGAAVFEIDASRVVTRPVAATFHGRDIFAPAAARVASGLDPESLGDPVERPTRLDWPEPRISGDRVLGSVIHVDGFGNAITNIDELHLEGLSLVRYRHTGVPRVRTYADAPPGTLVALVGSGGYLEIAEVRGSAAARLGIRIGDPVEVIR